MGLQLSEEFESFVQQRVESGVYPSAGEVVRTAFGLLEQRERLLAKLDAGIAQFSTGEFTEHDDESLERFLDDIETEARRLRAKKNGA
ncbi:MAG TPA: type II toxin-antitoxin system ParD family antitoxin [Pirellulales bacterium]|nr:type II toxin-antitoxin system ParD family antitoxin [Pirellulales bacterium]